MSYQTRAEYEPIGEASHQVVKNPIHDDSVFNLYGYKHHYQGAVIYHLFSLLLLGLPYAVFTWYPFLQKVRFKRCTLSTAEVVFIYDHFGTCKIIDIHSDSISLLPDGLQKVRYFCYQYTKYVWIADKASFDTLNEFMPKPSLEDVMERSYGLNKTEEANLLTFYGLNNIEVEIKSYWRLFVEEVFNPFYIFQAFSVILWFLDDYMVYAGCVLFLTLVSSITSLVQTRRQSVALHNLAATSHRGQVTVLRRHIISDPQVVPVDSSVLVPGHLLVIPRGGCVMPCDAILLTGNCVVNESMLTGESVPVMKTPPNPSEEVYNANLHKAHTLFSGTHVIQGRYYGDEFIIARVVRTGFDTTKGSLVKSIMFPAPIGFKFYKDSLKFVFFLFIIAGAGMCYCLYLYIDRRAEVREIIIRTLDIITIVVPPALPAAVAVGIVYSQNRLRKLGIFCISPPRINICGKLKLACFDKTGTLTHEGLDMYSILPMSSNRFSEAISDISTIDEREPLVQAMAACHSLTRIDGVLNGDPLDLIMFEHTKWVLEELGGKEEANYDMLVPTIVRPVQNRSNLPLVNIAGGDLEIPYEIGLVRQFPFLSSLQRMSVICRILDSPNMIVYTKGAPERIMSMCVYETIPPDFSNQLAQFTAQGFRVIALAYKQLPMKFKWKDAQKVKREIIECDLNFLGFAVMQNTLKPETTPVITTLRSANIRTLMITGDNIMTAICVARECGMVQMHDDVVLLQLSDETDEVVPKIQVEHIGNTNTSKNNVISFNNDHYHFAMDGKTWSKLRTFYPNILPAILLRTTVFARFQPDHKTQLITHLQELDYIVSMVGDGANDCGALKAAHIGVSLSQAEASVAAPFTSSIENISCLLYLMMEGRCALVTSFAVFKYMALYSLIQFFTIIILYKNNSILGDQQFLFIDLIITTSLAVTIGRQGPSKQLVPKRPMGSLISGTNLLPMILQIVVCGCVQYGALYYLTLQKWYTPNETAKDEIILCWENTVLFLVSSFQYVILALVYSKGRPYREMLLKNFWLLACALILTTFITYLCVYPCEEVAKFFEIIYLPLHDKSAKVIFRDTLLVFPMIHIALSYIIEFFIAESKWLKVLIHFIIRKKEPKNKYKRLSKEMDIHNWFHQEDDKSILNLPKINL